MNNKKISCWTYHNDMRMIEKNLPINGCIISKATLDLADTLRIHANGELLQRWLYLVAVSADTKQGQPIWHVASVRVLCHFPDFYHLAQVEVIRWTETGWQKWLTKKKQIKIHFHLTTVEIRLSHSPERALRQCSQWAPVGNAQFSLSFNNTDR